MSVPEEDVLEFIAASFPSVWALEVLLALKREQRTWTRDQLVASLRASDLVVNKAVDALVTAGLASIDARGVSYMPMGHDVEKSVERTEHLYRTRPNTVRRAIVSSRKSGATAFADAFKFRRERDD